MAWTVRLSSDAGNQLSKLPRDRQEIIGKAIDRMIEDPFRGNVKPLKGRKWKGRYRKVVGRYRLIFTPFHHQQTAEISQILIRAEKTYR